MSTKNFSDKEMACKCCGRVYVTPELQNALQAFRDLVGKPVIITSGGVYRCVLQNKLDGGKQNSYHVAGKAADITVPGLSVKEQYDAAMKIPAFANGGIGIYPFNNFIHVDVGHKRQWARIKDKKTKKDTYVSIEEGLKYVV